LLAAYLNILAIYSQQKTKTNNNIVVIVPVFFRAILCHGQSVDDPQEDLARSGYKLNMKVKFLKIPLYFWLAT
jgi:hypothetical protein